MDAETYRLYLIGLSGEFVDMERFLNLIDDIGGLIPEADGFRHVKDVPLILKNLLKCTLTSI